MALASCSNNAILYPFHHFQKNAIKIILHPGKKKVMKFYRAQSFYKLLYYVKRYLVDLIQCCVILICYAQQKLLQQLADMIR